jgi:peptidoglycan/xylan/chitin deacetylase (PgdA/CDA1 family)
VPIPRHPPPATCHPGAALITFDFEMAWGARWGAKSPDYWKQLRSDRPLVGRLLEILERHRLSATWATVGHLMLADSYPDWVNLARHAPLPGWYECIPSPADDQPGVFRTPESVEAIVSCGVHQELACHTFSHIIVGDPHCSRELVRLELQACIELAKKFGRPLRSVVFPRNSVGHLDVLEELGFTSYRGANSEWYWFGMPFARRKFRQSNPLYFGLAAAMRAGRLADERLRLCPPVLRARRVGRLWEIPHSMFLPPFAGLSRYVGAADRCRRAIKGIEAAAQQGKIFTLYTHPDNFHARSDDLFRCFDVICGHIARLRDEGKLLVLTMEQLAEGLSNGRFPHLAC